MSNTVKGENNIVIIPAREIEFKKSYCRPDNDEIISTIDIIEALTTEGEKEQRQQYKNITVQHVINLGKDLSFSLLRIKLNKEINIPT